MPAQLLPASAAAFSARAPPNIVLGSKVDPFLTTALKRVARRRPLNNVNQHYRCLNELLSGPSALWTLCTLFLPRAPLSELTRDDDPLVEAVFNYQMVLVEAYVVHVDMVSSQNEVAFKLTSDTIDALIGYHSEIHSVDAKNGTVEWSEKDKELKKLHEDFVQAVNKYVYRANVSVLEGLEEGGSGELLSGRSDDVKRAIMDMFRPLKPPPPPPPPKPVDIVRPTPVLPSSAGTEHWWPPAPAILPSNYFAAASGSSDGGTSTPTSGAQPAPTAAWKNEAPTSAPPPESMCPALESSSFDSSSTSSSLSSVSSSSSTAAAAAPSALSSSSSSTDACPAIWARHFDLYTRSTGSSHSMHNFGPDLVAEMSPASTISDGHVELETPSPTLFYSLPAPRMAGAAAAAPTSHCDDNDLHLSSSSPAAITMAMPVPTCASTTAAAAALAAATGYTSSDVETQEMLPDADLLHSCGAQVDTTDVFGNFTWDEYTTFGKTPFQYAM